MKGDYKLPTMLKVAREISKEYKDNFEELTGDKKSDIVVTALHRLPNETSESVKFTLDGDVHKSIWE